jgi:hypothetical protein
MSVDLDRELGAPDSDDMAWADKALGVGHSDVIDVHVALHARQNAHRVVTSDPDDMRAIDPTLIMIFV